MRNSFPLLVAMLIICGTAHAEAYRLTTVAEGLDSPWCVAFLPAGEMLITERPGQLRRVSASGELGPPIDGVPEVFFAGQGGLFDVAIHPDFPRNQLIYLAYAGGDIKANATHLASARLVGNKLEDVDVIFAVTPSKSTPHHFGGKVVFLPDGSLVLTTGDGFDHREQAQNPKVLLGKTVRVNDDGSIPADNPFRGDDAGHPAVWTLGHRNPQGLAYDPERKTLFLHEHGPRGGDEINILQPGNNYGWPVITYGIDYTGARITPFTEMPGLEQPTTSWVPSIAPSGLAVYRGSLFPQWTGDLLVGALVDREVRRVDPDTGEQEALFSELEQRIRDVRVGPEGAIYLVTDAGNLIRVTPE
jgi:glucose/arabinose dehydrogenase